MSADERLASLYAAIVQTGMRALVMGGHAVRFYGVERTTIDYDLHLVGVDWEVLPDALDRALAPMGIRAVEGTSWRPRDFRRFVIGRLPDGREERLECWRRNHLLAPFEQLFRSRSEGEYGGKTVAFLSLPDLIRSKETEREDDWRDIEALEEILDERRARSGGTEDGAVALLAGLRSRKGFERAAKDGLFEDRHSVDRAWNAASNPISRAYLAPYAGGPLPARASAFDEILARLGSVRPASARHLALVEAMRRLYKRRAMDADRQDKLGPAR